MNHMKTSSGLPCRYLLMFSWKVLWSTVFTAILRPPDCASYALNASANAFFGMGSDEFDPMWIVLPSPPGPLPHAVSSEGSVIAPAPTAAPRNRLRLDIRCPATLPGTPELSYEECAMTPSSGMPTQHNRTCAWISPPSQGVVKGFDEIPNNRYRSPSNRLQHALT